jgi:hypothetical protein
MGEGGEPRWPNVLRVETVLKPTLTLDWDKVEALQPASADPQRILPVSSLILLIEHTVSD